MTIDPAIAMNACPDCPADVAVVPSRSGITGTPVPVVTVSHQPTCPWALRFVGAPLAIAAGAPGIVIQMRATE